MDHSLENGGHHWADRLKVYRFFWPSSASPVPTINRVGLFLFLPVFLQILLCESTAQDFQNASQAGTPGAPILSWSASYQTHVKAEEIELKCLPPKGQMGENYFFYRINENGEETKYQQQIADRPPAPILSPDPPQPLYLVGENITLCCSPPNTSLQSWRRYQFSQITEPENQTSKKILDWHDDNSLVLIARREDSGLYTCHYLAMKYERNISSEWSLPVSIVVRDPLPPPMLKLHLSSGATEEGKLLSISCLSSKGDNPKRFYFSQDGVEMTSSNEGPLGSSRDSSHLTLNVSSDFPYVKVYQSLRFACKYEENIKGRWMMSPWSQNIIVEPVGTQDSDFIWSFARLVIPFIILLVPLAFYCWKKKNNVEITPGCTQNSFTPSSPEPTRKNHLTQENTEETSYYNLVPQLKKQQQSHP